MEKLSYELRARQQTALTPRLQQSVRLLQMSTVDFRREVAEAIANNPFLEELDEPAMGEPAVAPVPAIIDASGAIPGPAPSGEEPRTSKSADESVPDDSHITNDIADGASAWSGDYPSARNADQPDSDVGQWAHSEPGIKELLRNDLCGYELNERDRCLVEFIIEALDDDGYLRVPFSELAEPSQFAPPVSEGEWETALRLVQHLGPPGLAGRDLSECLTLQLNALPTDTPWRDLAIRIAAGFLDKLGRCEYAKLAQATGQPEEDVRQACNLIRTLDPRPAAKFAPADPSCYVIPDIVVRKAGKLWVATSNQTATPQARLNAAYAKLFRETSYKERPLMAQALQEARWLMRSLEQRKTTIQRVAHAIVARQQTFFDYGEIALRPMMLSEIAEELGVHESTVSRATSNKYLACPRGVVEFKYFFSRELATSSGGKCSATAVRALIQEMIDEENPKNPLSDVTLASNLAREGVIVARRTVSKYRAQIKYPPAEMRRAP